MHTTRREILKGVSLGASSALLGPIVQQLQAQAAGKELPKRFLFVVEGNGLPWSHIQPKGVERKGVVSGTYTNAMAIGNLGGKLKSGRYMEWPGHGAKGHRHIGNLYTTFLNAIGDTRETFGQ